MMARNTKLGFAWFALAMVGLAGNSLFGATRTWDGSSSGLWTTAANWDINTVPVNGDTLIFPPGPARLLTTNSAGGATNFHAINLTGSNYFLFGPLLSLTNGLTNLAALNSTNTIAARVLLRTNQAWHIGVSNTLVLSSNVGFTNVTWLLTNQGNVQFNGAMASASATMVSTGAGQIYFAPGSSGQASLTMQQGRLRVDGTTAINVAVNANAVLSGTGTVSSISAHGVVSPGNDGPAVLATGSTPSFFFNGSTIALDLNGTTPGAGHDQLRVGFPPTLTGATLAISIGFSPNLGDVFVIITNQSITPIGSNQYFASLPEGATQTVNNIQFRISYVGGSHNDVTLTVVGILPTGNTRVWTGAGGNGSWSNPTNWAGTIIEPIKPGDSLRFPVFESIRITSNDFAGGFVADRIIINGTNSPAAFTFRGNRVDLMNGITSISQNTLSHQFFCPVRLLAPQTFGADHNGGLHFFGEVDNNGFLLTTTNADTASLRFDAPIIGAGGLTHSGPNAPALSLQGTNTFAGPCTVAAGRIDPANAFALGAASGELFIGANAGVVLQSGFDFTKSSLSLTGTFSSAFTNTFNGEVRLFGALPTITGGPQTRMTLNGPVIGTSQLTKSGAGILELPGANTYSGGTFLGSGTLLVNGTMPFGTISIAGSATLAGTGVVGNVSMTTGSAPKVSPGASPGSLTVSNVTFRDSGEFIVELNGATPGAGHDQLIVRGSVDLANADLRWSLGFNPPFSQELRIIDNDGVDAVISIFEGLPEGSSLVTNGVTLRLSYVGGDGNDVTLTRELIGTGVTRIWDAGGANNFWSNPTNWAGDVVPVTGDAILFPSNLSPGDSQTTNDLLAGTIFDQLIVSNGSGVSTVLNGNSIGLINGVLGTNSAGSFRVQLPLQLAGPQTFALSAATYTFGGPISLNGNLTLGGNSINMTGAVSGVGGIIKTNGGSFLLDASNSFDGPVQILGGVLNLGHPSALGLPGSGTFIGSGAVLLLGHTGTLAEHFLSITGSLSALFTNTVTGQIELPNVGTPFNGGSGRRLTLSGSLTGAGSPLFQGGGTFVLTGTNECTGETSIQNGTLFVHGRSTAGDLNVSPSTAILGGTGVVGRLSVQNNGTMNPGASPGVLSSSNLFAANSSTLLFELDAPTAGSGYDQLNVSGTVSLGSGALALAVGFTPPHGTVFTIINNDGADAVSGTFGGLPEGATFSTNGLNFRISYIGGTGNDVTLTRFVPPTGITRVWDGGGTNGFWSNPTNWLGDILPGQGDTLAFPAAAARKVNTNDFASDTVFNAIQFPGNGYTLRGNPAGVISSLVGSNATGVNFIDLDLNLGGGQTVAQHGGAGLVINGDVALGGDISVFGSGSVNFNGPVSGAGGVIAQGPGNVILNTANTYAGTTEVQGGTLTIGTSTSLGSAAAGTIVREGATLVVNAEVNVPEPLLLSGVLNNSADSNEWSGPITLASPDVQFVIDDQALTVSGVVSGTDGFIKRGTEILRLTAANTYSGDTIVADGKLIIDGAQPSSRIRLAGGTLAGNGIVERIADSGGGTIAPGVSPGILSSSNLTLGASSIFAVELNGVTPGPGHDQLNVSGSVTLGNAALNVSVGFTPSPGSPIIILQNDGADSISGIFAGRPEGSLITNGAVVLQITYAGGTGNDVALMRVLYASGVTRTWDGGGTNNFWMNASNWVGDVLPAEGDALVFPPGAARLVNSNNFPAGTAFDSLLFSGSGYEIRGSRLELLNGVLAASGAAGISLPLGLLQSQTFSNAGLALDLFAPVNLRTHTLTVGMANNASTLFQASGTITGSTGGLLIAGTGSGAASFFNSNSFDGPVNIQSGRLDIRSAHGLGSTVGHTSIGPNGTLELSAFFSTLSEPLIIAGQLRSLASSTNSLSGPITLASSNAAINAAGQTTIPGNLIAGVPNAQLRVGGLGRVILKGTNNHARTVVIGTAVIDGFQPGSETVMEAGRLNGTGTVGDIRASNATARVSAGLDSGTGILTASNLFWNSTLQFIVDINGPTLGVDYDQLAVRGTVGLNALSPGRARLVLSNTFAAPPGMTFVIIANDGMDPVQGTFQEVNTSNLIPEGALLTNGPAIFRISYVGGDGNDVTLTVPGGPEPSTIQFSGVNSNGLFTLTGAGISNALYVLEATPHLNAPIPWQAILTNISGTNGLYQFIDPNSTNFPIRFYRVRSP
jgi:fibronectin-binding autotransporter adhesin